MGSKLGRRLATGAKREGAREVREVVDVLDLRDAVVVELQLREREEALQVVYSPAKEGGRPWGVAASASEKTGRRGRARRARRRRRGEGRCRWSA